VPLDDFSELDSDSDADSDELQWVGPSRPLPRRLTNDALAQTVPQRSTTDVHPDDVPLAGYLLARQADGRPVEGQDLDLLRDAHDSVREARSLLPLGRGNVREDIIATKGLSTGSVNIARHLQKSLGTLSDGQAAILVGAGNCGEHANLTAIAMASRAAMDIKARLTTRPLIDHTWTEASRKGDHKDREHTAVLDAWRDGPAVFAPDHAHAAWTFGLKTIKKNGLEDRRHFTRAKHGDAMDRAKKVAQEVGMRGPEIVLPRQVDVDLKHKLMWDNKSGVEPGFARRAAERLAKEITPQQAYADTKSTTRKVKERLSSTRDTVRGALAGALGLRKEPQATPAAQRGASGPAPTAETQAPVTRTLRELLAQERAEELAQEREKRRRQRLESLPENSDATTLPELFTRDPYPRRPSQASRREIREAEKMQRPVPAALRADIQALGIARQLAPEIITADPSKSQPEDADPRDASPPTEIDLMVADEQERSGALRALIAEADLSGYGLVNAVTGHAQLVDDFNRSNPTKITRRLNETAKLAGKIAEAARTLGQAGPSTAVYPFAAEPAAAPADAAASESTGASTGGATVGSADVTPVAATPPNATPAAATSPTPPPAESTTPGTPPATPTGRRYGEIEELW
jgi:hypothetical protein